MCSRARSSFFQRRPPVKPPSPFAATTRWHGMTMHVRFLPSAWPTALAASGRPIAFAMSPYVRVSPYGIARAARSTARSKGVYTARSTVYLEKSTASPARYRRRSAASGPSPPAGPPAPGHGPPAGPHEPVPGARANLLPRRHGAPQAQRLDEGSVALRRDRPHGVRGDVDPVPGARAERLRVAEHSQVVRCRRRVEAFDARGAGVRLQVRDRVVHAARREPDEVPARLQDYVLRGAGPRAHDLQRAWGGDPDPEPARVVQVLEVVPRPSRDVSLPRARRVRRIEGPHGAVAPADRAQDGRHGGVREDHRVADQPPAEFRAGERDLEERDD